MNDKVRGEPAFPGQGKAIIDPGMTLRDYFAAQALVGTLAAAEEHFTGDGKSEEAVSAWHAAIETNWAKFCYRMADAMLAERQK